MEGRAIQILHERMAPGTDTGADMLRHESEEGGVVVRGKIELTVGGQVYILGPGDGYYFDSRLPHRFRNIWDEVGEIVSCCSPPSF
jgi:mannose-6-phosphate isomerase-like protein (cupin superfamily)